MPYVEMNDGRFHYHMHGRGEPLLLINGFCGDLYSWNRFVPLIDNRYRSIVFDNRGSGLTVSPDLPFTMERMADDASDLLEAIGVEKAHVLGWSMGGNIAQELAIRHPDKVAALVLVSTYMRRPPRSSYVIDAMVNSVKEGASIETFWAMMSSWCLTNATYDGRENIAPTMKRRPIEEERKMITGFSRQKEALDCFDSKGRLQKITSPVLVVHGTDDIMVPPRFGRELAADLRNAELIFIEGAGHIIPPDKYIKHVLSFLDRNGFACQRDLDKASHNDPSIDRADQ